MPSVQTAQMGVSTLISICRGDLYTGLIGEKSFGVGGILTTVRK